MADPFSYVADRSQQSRQFRWRAIIAAFFSMGVIFALFMRLGYLQVVEYAYFSDLSENNRVRLMALPPNRGLIYDRNGVVMAENRPTFHLEIIPEQIEDLDATLKGLREIVNLREQDIKRFRTSMRTHRSFESISLRTRLDDEEVARLAVNRHRFPGMDISARLSRHYPQGKSAAHAIGYVGRINENELETLKDIDQEGNYRGTMHIGKTGVEKYYEADLHGIVGQQNVEVNAEGRLLRVINKEPPVPGSDLVLGLDMELQQIAVEALGDLAGSVIAMVPQTGEILVYVSKPEYDPNLFVHGISFDEYEDLQKGDYKPLFNRALYGQYPPGSTYKPFVGLAGLESRVISSSTSLKCKGHYLLPDDPDERKYRDWKKEGHGITDLGDAMEQSCDVYFYELSHRLGIDRIHDFLAKFGFGTKTGIDLLGERSGLLPSREWKKRVHGTIWYPGETLISGIGQGYMLTTPLQLARATSALATRGLLVRPHLAKALRDADGNEVSIKQAEATQIKLRNPHHWSFMQRSMRRVVHGTLGTARATGWGLEYQMAGKTGTAQVFGIGQDEEYDEKTVAQKLKDHGLFIAFAPFEAPSIVVAIVGENAEHGSTVARIARKIMDKHLVKESEVSETQ